MKKIMLLMLVLMVVSIGVTSAAIDTVRVDDVVRLNEVVNYSKGCFFNGTYCSTSAVCNYTMFRPDKTIFINNAEATNYFYSHNLEVSFQEVGVYQIDMVCHDQGWKASETFYTQVTGSGLNSSSTFLIIILLISFGIIIFGLWLGDAPITILGTFGLYFLALFILFNGIAEINDLMTTRAIGIIILGIAMYISVKSAHELIVG